MSSNAPRVLQRPRYNCPCGSVISSAPYAKKRHYTTKKHQDWQHQQEVIDLTSDVKEEKYADQNHIDECPICYEEGVTEVSVCTTCQNELCFTCYGELRAKKCPYCRSDIRDVSSFEKVEGEWVPIRRGVRPRRPRRTYPKAQPRAQRNRSAPERYSPSQPVQILGRVRERRFVEEKEPEKTEEDFIREMNALLHESPRLFMESLERLKTDRRAYIRIMDRVFSDSVTLTFLNQ